MRVYVYTQVLHADAVGLRVQGFELEMAVQIRFGVYRCRS